MITIKQLSALTPFKIDWVEGEEEKSSIFYLDYLRATLLNYDGTPADEELAAVMFNQVKSEVHDPEVPEEIQQEVEAAQAALIDSEQNAKEELPKEEEPDVGHETEPKDQPA